MLSCLRKYFCCFEDEDIILVFVSLCSTTLFISHFRLFASIDSGNGATSAVELLIDCLGLQHASADGTNCPVVFVGPYEHHSNLIPWRESGCEIVMVPECENTRSVDMLALERLLQNPKHENRLKMGTFTAASNVTGKVCDVDRIAATLHRFGALAFFDYATGAAYMSVDMNPPPSSQYPSSSLVAKDAVFLSPHKMLGGVGTPGVLIIKKHLVNQVNAPSRSGGGTVFYVTSTHHRFLSNRIERYEGGSPNVMGILRVGLAFLLKRKAEEKFAVLADRTDGSAESKVPRSIEDYDCLTHERVANYLREHAPNLVLLGGGDGGRNLPIFSFLIRFGSRFLHYNYVCAILNDVFGIQSRGGCQCSGPYSQRLLGLTEMSKDGEIPNIRNEAIESALLHFKERAELLRPGYTRISLPFKGLCAEEVDYVLKALVWVSENGWSLMCQYRCNHRTGEVRICARLGFIFAYQLV
jgi:selenocysteine lyase/cysteine desulfurase